MYTKYNTCVCIQSTICVYVYTWARDNEGTWVYMIMNVLDHEGIQGTRP